VDKTIGASASNRNVKVPAHTAISFRRMVLILSLPVADGLIR
jgi:hypothetical protein